MLLTVKDNVVYLLILSVLEIQGLQEENNNNAVSISEFKLRSDHLLENILQLIEVFKQNDPEAIKTRTAANNSTLDNDTNVVIAVIINNKHPDLRDSNITTLIEPYQSLLTEKPLIAKKATDKKKYVRNKKHQSRQGNDETKIKRGESDDEEEFDALNITNCSEEKKNILRKRWRSSCNKKASKTCKKACKQAYKNSCSIYSCSSRKKRNFKKECKETCRSKFNTDSSDSESDSYSGSDSDF